MLHCIVLRLLCLEKTSNLQLQEMSKQLLIRCLQECLEGPVLKFATVKAKREALDANWHSVFLLYSASVQPNAMEYVVERDSQVRTK